MIDKMLNLSNGHVDPSKITDDGSDSLDTGKLRNVSHQHGWIVFVFPDCPEVPDWLKPIHDRAVQEDATLILFDRDGDEFDDFKKYGW